MKDRSSSSVSRRQFLARTAAPVLAAPFFVSRSVRAEAARPLNVLLFFPDQHRPDWAQWNPELPVRTPNLMRLAEEGVRFTHAFCPAPLCAPSRASLALGLRYGRHSVRSNGDNLPDGAKTLYTRLRDAGYRVGSVGKLDLHKAAKDWGPDGQHQVNGRAYFREWGFTDGLDSEGKSDSFNGIHTDPKTGRPRGDGPYTRMLTDRNDGSLEEYLAWRKHRDACTVPPNGYAYTEPTTLSDAAYNDNWVAQKGLDVLHDFPKRQPWFLQVNLPGPHEPMDITPAMAEWYKDVAFPGPVDNTQAPAETHTAIRRNYSAMVENIDRWLGRYLDAVETRGERANTLIVYCSDHGEMLGDHNRWAKTYPYQPSAGVPLVIAGPGVRKGQTVQGPVETLDLTATVLECAGRETPDDMDSRSLMPILRDGNAPYLKVAYSAYGGWELVCDGRYKLIRGFDPAGEKVKPVQPGEPAKATAPMLFDLESDPGERQNIAEAQPEQVRRLTACFPGPRG